MLTVRAGKQLGCGEGTSGCAARGRQRPKGDKMGYKNEYFKRKLKNNCDFYKFVICGWGDHYPPDTKKPLPAPLIRCAQIQGAYSSVILNSVRWPPAPPSRYFQKNYCNSFPLNAKKKKKMHRSTFTDPKAIDNSEVQRSLQKCGSSEWNLLLYCSENLWTSALHYLSWTRYSGTIHTSTSANNRIDISTKPTACSTPSWEANSSSDIPENLRIIWNPIVHYDTYNSPPLPITMRVGTLIVATIYLQLIQNRYMFRSFTVLQCSHQHCVQPVASDVEVVGYL